MPLWVANWGATTQSGKNYGEKALNVLKIVISDDNIISGITDIYMGFFIPRGKPFMKSTGQNEVEILANEKYQCWMYGNY